MKYHCNSLTEAVDIDTQLAGLPQLRPWYCELLNGGIGQQSIQPLAGQLPRGESALQEEFVVRFGELHAFCIFSDFVPHQFQELLPSVSVIVAHPDGPHVESNYQIALYAKLVGLPRLSAY